MQDGDKEELVHKIRRQINHSKVNGSNDLEQ